MIFNRTAIAEWCEKCFDKIDDNGDGRLTRNEAEASMFARRFDQLDQDDDDRLSKTEAKQGVQTKLESQSVSRTQSEQSNRR